jgi:hypothetical protein
LTEVLVNVEKHDLTITTTYADLIFSDSLDAFYALRTHVLSEYQDLILDLETAEVST